MIKRDPAKEARILRSAIKQKMKKGLPLIGSVEEIIKDELDRQRKAKRIRQESIKQSIASAKASKAFQYISSKVNYD